MPNEFRARLEMHLPEGYSKVRIEIGGRAYCDWNIPTRYIPPHLRKMGSRFIVISHGLNGWPEGITAEQVRASFSYEVLELGDDDQSNLSDDNR